MSEPEILDMGGMLVFSWPEIDLGMLDWQPMHRCRPAPRQNLIVQDADGKTWLVQRDRRGVWREMIDGQLLGKVVPVRWAVPTDDMVEALAFG